ncbi:DUF3108 domain-containing protein [Alkalisalibacterium limincola]|nr:DUF3108 domain-containing protein [Alkalisalibacterium limincola]
MASTPAAYSAEYEVLRNGRALGQADVRVSAAGNGVWEMHSQTRGTRGVASLAGVEVTERSRFRWTPDLIEAMEYDYSQRAATRSRERSVRVDAGGGSIVTRDRDEETRLPYQAGVLDRHILPLAIARDLASGNRGPLRYQVADRGEVDEHVYRVTGTERVATPKGEVEAVKLERQRANSDRVTTMWMDPGNGYLPVRVVQNEGRDTMETRLVRSSR